jgi:ribose/xylose/arabinose/galactoside ABC-type transport system permease subunit
MKKKQKLLLWLSDNSIFFLLSIILVLAALVGKSFYTKANLMLLLKETSLYGIIAIGITFVLLLGFTDMSIGPQVSMFSVIAILASQRFGLASMVLSCVLLSIISGLLNGLLVSKVHVVPFITTLGTMTVFKGIALILAGGKPIASSLLTVYDIYTYELLGVPISIVVFLIFLIIAAYLLYFTKFGLQVYACGGNLESAKAAGINTDRITIICYLLSAFCASCAGAFYASRMGVGSPVLGDNYTLPVIASCVIGGIRSTGGKGNFVKTFCGVLFMQIIYNLMAMSGFDAYTQYFVIGVVILGVLFLDKYTEKVQKINLAQE